MTTVERLRKHVRVLDNLNKARTAPIAMMALRCLEHYWYCVGIAMMFVIGWKYQFVGLWMKSIGVTPYLIALAFFLNGFALVYGNAAREPKAVANAGMRAVYLVRHFSGPGLCSQTHYPWRKFLYRRWLSDSLHLTNTIHFSG